MEKLDKESIIGISALLVHAANIDEIYSEHEKNLVKDFIKSYVKDDKSGVVFNNTSKDLAKAINIVLNKKNNYNYSRNIKKNKKKYSWDKFADELIKFTFNI